MKKVIILLIILALLLAAGVAGYIIGASPGAAIRYSISK